MPPQNNQNQPSPFEITTAGKSKKRGGRGIVVAILIVVFLALSVVAGVLLVRQRQNIQEKAAVSQCPAIEACPVSGQPNLLRNCHPAGTDGAPTESLCDTIGRVATCGAAGTSYCCPTVGGAWTKDMTVCNSLAQASLTLSPTPIPTPTPTPTTSVSPTATPTPTPTSTAISSPTATPRSIPVSGVDWPTVAGIGVGAAAIILSILIAL